MFSHWINRVITLISPYGLYIDEHTIKNPGHYISFLDIMFCFDSEGQLQTDLYVKETDARSYLFYGSSHANHVFAGIVYSQCLRLRRIINNQERLNNQLEILKECFLNCNYPKKMVDNITSKFKSFNRILKRKEQTNVSTSPDTIRVVSTFNSDRLLVDVTESHSSSLSLTQSFSSVNTDQKPPSTSPNSKKSVFNYVKRTGSSLRNKLVRTKELAIGGYGNTEPCNKPKCKLCEVICDRSEISVNGVRISPSRGNCTIYNIVYLFICTLCDKPFVGRTVNPLNIRTNQHRSAFYRVLSAHKNGKLVNSDLELDNGSDDIYSLGMHIVIDHKLSEKGDFDKFYRVSILSSNSSPSSLEVKEHKFIHRLNSLRPSGINRANPFSIPPLNLIFTNPSAI